MPVPHSAAAERVIDAERYPLADRSSPARAAVVERVRRDLAADGCSVLPDFVRPALLAALREEAARLAPLAHVEVATVNVYNTAPDPTLPAGHPARTTMRRGNAFVARDLIPPDALVHRLYTDPDFQRFVADCFDLPQVHELADPLAGLCLNVLAPGEAHPWHFDTNEFTVSMLVQQPESGGRFEYCAHIRSPGEENLDGVRAVLGGRAPDRVRALPLRPGDLQLFRGRYSLHRVSAVAGGTARHSAIFAYSARPGVVGTAERTRQLFGRTAPQHTAARGPATRSDRLMD
jgi:hypothetical protein